MPSSLWYDPPLARRTRMLADAEAARSGLPGYSEGPQDALRHIIGTAEPRRLHGWAVASAIAEANERYGDARWGRQDALTLHMDRTDNAIGLRIGGTAQTYAEVVDRARDAVRASLARGGGGAEGTPIWLPPERWRNRQPADTDVDRTIPTEMPDWEPDPSYRYGGREHGFLRGPRGATPREREARLLADLADAPPEEWSREDARAVVRSRPYANPNDPAHEAWQTRVRRYYEAEVAREAAEDDRTAAVAPRRGGGAGEGGDGCGGTAEVRAYTRRGPSGPVAVAAHERAIGCR